MKITKISLQGFRAFDEPFDLELDGGKNLLLYGENGSGKSSIYLALNRFFEEQGGDVTKHRHRFAADARETSVEIETQHSDAAGTPVYKSYKWDRDFHPLPVPVDPAAAPIMAAERSTLVDAARRAGFLDYRSMLRTNLIATPLNRSNRGPTVHDKIYGVEADGLGVQLFDLVTLVVLEGVRCVIPGGTEKTIGELIRAVFEHRPQSRHQHEIDHANDHANLFSNAFNGKRPEVQEKLSEFLSEFQNHSLTVELPPVALAWEKESLTLTGAELIPIVTFRGQPVDDFQSVLNEARLSAFALCLFLAGVVLSDNDYDNANHPRFLFLDDALIGLELQNRLPILNILTSDRFRHYQIFLFTHDRVWYDLSRKRLPEDSWLQRELLADESTGVLIPRCRSSEDDIERAQLHLANGDLRAAAVYARSAFEWKLRSVCENRGIKVPFKSTLQRISADALWSGIVERQRKREQDRANGAVVNDFVTPALETAVETMRSTVLNQLAHVGPPGLVAGEVQAAIDTVRAVQQHPFPRN
jgi:energy-coupling factor transporter ATP-binding protein EcfA2